MKQFLPFEKPIYNLFAAVPAFLREIRPEEGIFIAPIPGFFDEEEEEIAP